MNTKLLNTFTFSRDDGVVDKLSRRYTVILFLIFGVFVIIFQVYGKPISCSTPEHFNSGMSEFAHHTCLYTDYYSVLKTNKLTTPEITYNFSKWFGIFMFFQAFISYLPSLLWKGFYRAYGINLDQMVNATEDYGKTENSEMRNRKLQILSSKILQKKSQILPLVYAFIRKLYLFNALGQMAILGILFNWGIFNSHYNKVINKLPLTLSKQYTKNYFLTKFVCDYSTHKKLSGRILQYSLECTSSINHWNTFIFHLLWFWLLFVSIITLFSSLYQSIRYLNNSDTFLKEQLSTKLRGNLDIKDFKRFLCRDGEFILKVISENSNNIVTSEITCQLWDNYAAVMNKTETKSFEIVQGQAV